MNLDTIKTNLGFLDGLDRLNYLIDLSKNKNKLEKKYKVPKNKIPGCVSNAYLLIEKFEPCIIKTESDSEFVNGLLYILELYVNNKSKNDIMKINEIELMDMIGLKNTITSQRVNGFYSTIKTLKKRLIDEYKNF